MPEYSLEHAVLIPYGKTAWHLQGQRAYSWAGSPSEQKRGMTMRRSLRVVAAAAGLVGLVAVVAALPTSSATLQVGENDIGGVVTGTRGPEAGVWVIAETTELPTKFVRIVVTDDQGRYLIPDLPKASYSVWVRGYGLVDSPKSKSSGGKTLNLTAIAAPNPRAAAAYYPAGHWFSLLQVPDKSQFPGTGPNGNGFSPNIKSQADFVRAIKSGTCMACHQLGSKGTREIPAAFATAFPSSYAAWERRVQSGQAGTQMLGAIDQLGHQGTLKMFADWTDRIAAGEVPVAPRRPQGIERNVVITEWDWADPKSYLHDVVSTDRRNPTLNANGLLYGSLELSSDYLPVLDPVHNTVSRVPLTVRDPNTQPATGPPTGAPSAYGGDEVLWMSKNNVHNPMFDEDHVDDPSAGQPGVLQGWIHAPVGEGVPAGALRAAARDV